MEMQFIGRGINVRISFLVQIRANYVLNIGVEKFEKLALVETGEMYVKKKTSVKLTG